MLSDVRAQPSKKDDGCATLETEGDLPDTTAIIQTLMLHRDLIMSNQMICPIVEIECRQMSRIGRLLQHGGPHVGA